LTLEVQNQKNQANSGAGNWVQEMKLIVFIIDVACHSSGGSSMVGEQLAN